MTERKPIGMSWDSWIDRQIDEAQQRGAFDDLPGTGKPIPRDGPEDGQAWLRNYLRREGVSTEAMLPTPLRLRKETERLAATVPELRSEREVREVVAELNRRIAEHRRIPVGPPVYLRLVDEEEMVRRWRAARPVPAPAPPGTTPAARTARPAARPRWWRRLRRRDLP